MNVILAIIATWNAPITLDQIYRFPVMVGRQYVVSDVPIVMPHYVRFETITLFIQPMDSAIDIVSQRRNGWWEESRNMMLLHEERLEARENYEYLSILQDVYIAMKYSADTTNEMYLRNMRFQTAKDLMGPLHWYMGTLPDPHKWGEPR